MDKIVHVVGARPNFMKVAPVIEALTAEADAQGRTLKQILVHTGQHYSPEMSTLFFDELGLPVPDINLEIGSGSHGQQTGRIMEAFEQVLFDEKPDAVLVVGDVNSTIACALDAKKLGIEVIHVEAGLRSGDLGMPEEINRILTDSISDKLFITEPSAEHNLAKEGVPAERVHFVGNVMIDSLLKHRDAALARNTLEQFPVSAGEYLLVTLHRPSNVDDEKTLGQLVDAILEASKALPVLMPLHPRTAANLERFGLKDKLASDRITITEPQGYLDFMHLTANARAVLTDSGGIQEETTILGVPCITARENTERPVTISCGTNQLVDSNWSAIGPALKGVLARDRAGNGARVPDMWDGSAARRIAKILLK